MKKFLLPAIAAAAFPLYSSAQTNVPNDTLALHLNEQNTVFVQAVFNEKDTLNLNFDTGTSELVLTREVLNSKLHSETKLYRTPYSLKIGNYTYQTNVYDAELAGHGTEGRFGWDLFKNRIVELDYDAHLMVVGSELPAYVVNNDAYTPLDITYFDNVFSVEATLIQNGIESRQPFLFDTGYQRTAMLDTDVMKADNFPFESMKVVKKVLMKGGQGNEIPVITSDLEQLNIGTYALQNVPVQQLTSHKPMKGTNMHILGNEVLKRFHIFLDFQNNKVYLKPNSLYRVAYIEHGTKET